MSWWRENRERALFAVSTALLVAGGVAWLLDAETTASVLWIAGTVLGLVFSVGWMVGSIRRGQLSVDVIAVLALAGALVVNEPFAGAMITVMLASGQLLEARAAARSPRSQWMTSWSVTGCWSAPERLSRWTAGCCRPPCWRSPH